MLDGQEKKFLFILSHLCIYILWCYPEKSVFFNPTRMPEHNFALIRGYL